VRPRRLPEGPGFGRRLRRRLGQGLDRPRSLTPLRDGRSRPGPGPRPVGRPAPLLRLPAHRSADMSTASTTSMGGPTVPAAGSVHETFLDRLGIPHALRWGFLGVLVFMTGNGVETNFVSPHMAKVFGGGDEMINLAATVI